MKRIYTIPDLPDTLASRCKPNDLIPFAYDQNGCMYRWGVPFKNFEKLKELSLNQPYKIADLQSLDCIVLDIVIFDRYTIKFDTKTGVQKLKVSVRSSETENKQLLHKLSTDFRTNAEQVDKDSIPRTNNTNE